MRCGGEFACRTAGCEAKYDVLPRIVQRAADGSVEVVEHECVKPPGEQGKADAPAAAQEPEQGEARGEEDERLAQASSPAPKPEQGEARGKAPAAVYDWTAIAVDLREELYRRVAGTAIVDTWFAIVRKHRLPDATPPAQAEPDALREARGLPHDGCLACAIADAHGFVPAPPAPAPAPAPRSGIPLLDHAFVPNTWAAVDACDARVSDPGSQISRQCGRPRKEHPAEEGAK